MNRSHSPTRSRTKAFPDGLEPLLLRANRGDLTALGQMLGRLRPALSRSARWLLGEARPGGIRPSDLVQETCVLALHGFSGFRGETAAQLWSWLYRILQNATKQALRKSRADVRADRLTTELLDEHRSAAATQSRLCADRQQYRQIVAAMSHLPGRQRQALYLRLLQERSLAEISQSLELREQAVASLIKRGLQHLRRQLVPAEKRLRSARAASVDAALLAYLRLSDCGERPERAAFLSRHPDCAATLSPLLDWLHQVTEQLAEA